MDQKPPHLSAPPQFFVDNKKGELNELRQLLKQIVSERDQKKRREVVKKVIAYMTLGIDVSSLFTDMVLISATTDIVQKKMIYLYLTSYVERNQEQALMVINTFFKDCQKAQPDSKIRGLALRSLCSLRFTGVVEYIQPSVEEGLKDPDPYVRRIAVIGLLKLFRFNKATVLENDTFINTLYELIRDSDSVVSTNAILVLNEVLEDEGGIAVNRRIVIYLLNRLPQYNEFSQSVVFDVVNRLVPTDDEEKFDIMSALEDKLRHASSSVVLGCIKVFLNYTKDDPVLLKQVFTRVGSILITHVVGAAVSGSQELCYCVLCHILCIIKCGASSVFEADYKNFFCKYDDPTYVEFTKIDILTLISSESNYNDILNELAAYVTDVNAEIAKKSIQSIGTIAMRVAIASAPVVQLLKSFLGLNTDYVISETLVTIKDLLRKYRGLSVEFITNIDRSLEIVTEDEGKAAVIWVIGEFGESIENAPYTLETLVNGTSPRESLIVTHSLLTACVKLFLKRAPEMHSTLATLFSLIFSESDDPDLHDRTGFYYKLLQMDPTIAHSIVNSEKHAVTSFYEADSSNNSYEMLEEFNQLSVIYGKTAKKMKPANEHLVLNEPEINHEIPPPAQTEADLLLIDLNWATAPGENSVLAQFSLQKDPAMTSDEFQELWVQLEEDFNITRVLNGDPDVGTIEGACTLCNILCMASGAEGSSKKFYFYGKDRLNFAYLSEVNLDSHVQEFNLVIKGQEGGQVDEFARIMKDALGSFIQIS